MFRSKTPTILSAAALVIAVLGSTPVGQAAGRMILPSNSVGTTQLKPAAVTAAKIKNGTLTAAKFRGGQFPVGPAGPQGLKGDTGAQGPAGPKGDPGSGGKAVVHLTNTPVSPGVTAASIASCAAGERATGGGGVFVSNAPVPLQDLPTVVISMPLNAAGDPPAEGEVATKWAVVGKNVAPTFFNLRAYVVCVPAA